MGPLTFLDHDEGCGFPEGPCTTDAHRLTVHVACGLPLLMRFCGCPPGQGWTLDPERDWWVDHWCGWPRRAWFEASGTPAPPGLAGRKPVTWHDYPSVTGKARERLGEDARRRNTAAAGTGVRD